MTPRQRAVLVALGGAVAVLVAALLGIVLAGRKHTSTLAATSTPTTVVGSDATSSTTPTTLQLLPVMPTAPPTSTPSTVPGTVPATTTSTVPPIVNGSGAVLAPAGSPDERVESPGLGCAGLADAGWGSVHCGVARAGGQSGTGGAMLTWLIESRPANPAVLATRAYVFRMTPSGTEQVVLQAFDDTGARFTSVQARVDSVEGTGGSDIVFGFRNQGSAEMLSLDLVQGPGVVAVHQDLYRGVARTTTGQLDTWSAVLAAGDANCCPSSFQHDSIRFVGGAWRLVAAETVSPSAVPPSEL